VKQCSTALVFVKVFPSFSCKAHYRCKMCTDTAYATDTLHPAATILTKIIQG